LIHVVVWQKPTHYQAIFLQLKDKKKKKITIRCHKVCGSAKTKQLPQTLPMIQIKAKTSVIKKYIYILYVFKSFPITLALTFKLIKIK